MERGGADARKSGNPFRDRVHLQLPAIATGTPFPRSRARTYCSAKVSTARATLVFHHPPSMVLTQHQKLDFVRRAHQFILNHTVCASAQLEQEKLKEMKLLETTTLPVLVRRKIFARCLEEAWLCHRSSAVCQRALAVQQEAVKAALRKECIIC